MIVNDHYNNITFILYLWWLNAYTTFTSEKSVSDIDLTHTVTLE